MALNMKNVERHRNKADELLESAKGLNPPETSTSKTITSLSETTTKSNNEQQDTISEQLLDYKGNPDRGYGRNLDGSFKQSPAGRKSKSSSEKKAQIVVTIEPQASNRLKEWAKSKPRSASNYLSMYIEDHIDEIIKYFDKR